LPITAVCNTDERSFSQQVEVDQTFRRSTMTDERLRNLEMISIESETAKPSDMTELTKIFASLKIWKMSFSSL